LDQPDIHQKSGRFHLVLQKPIKFNSIRRKKGKKKKKKERKKEKEKGCGFS
jgi:hypothetical protein